ncbi:mitochondrial FAD carrier protein flx1 [Ceratocystis pirilliformis]|uniref:Mitochondrial FAD carrier protein flx1 n=1 Tax=Ceratocystis pirilliformis TaxID=259994 RepID=A0ABR3YHG1_9PEZI
MPSQSPLSPASIESIAGLMAGSVATLVVHPLDIVKTRMQIYRSATATGGKLELTTLGVLRSLVAHDTPMRAFYRGLTPNLVGNAAGWASFFFFKAKAEQLIMSLRSERHHAHAHNDGGFLAPYEHFLASAMAGATTTMLTNPIWVLKTRMLSSNRASEGAYQSMSQGVRAIYHTEGLSGFYRGVLVSLMGVSHGAVQFAVYDPLKRVYLATQPGGRNGSRINLPATKSSGGEHIQRLDVQATLAISTLAKLVAGAATYPYQVIRARMQNYDSEKRFGKGVAGVAGRVYREEGLRGFYRGLGPAVLRVMPATWVTFLVYENVKHQLKAM